ncbi:MAG TPA: tRNA dihydrouridine synthase DusB [Nitrospirota bacterium]|nr:tRNA dihydrouridine synthase DusB [Nitrospirota bacterium]
MSIHKILKTNPLVLAPMAGITDFPFRMICKAFGAGLVFSEMVSVEALIREHRRTHDMLRTDPSERPVVFQIFGSKPASMAEAAHIVSRGEVDFIDINMGCPVPKILKSGAGAALLRDIGLAKEIMSAVVSASKVPVTIKIRLGWDSRSIVAIDMAQAAESIGIAAVTVHGRTKAQGFSGSADWSMIKQVKESVGIPVIGNGDVHTARDAKRLMEETGCDGIMIGRAIQGYPWIFREVGKYLETGIVPPPPTIEERRAVMMRHFDDMVNLVGEDVGVREIRKHLCWYTKGLPNGAEFRTRINHFSQVEEVKRAIQESFVDVESGVPASHQA